MHKFRNFLQKIGVAGLSVLLFMGSIGIVSLNSHAYAIGGQTIASLTNGERAARGLAPLAWSGALSSSAAMKAQDMCAKGYWAHTGPDGATGWTFMSRAGYPYATAGENLAKDFSTDSGVVAGWMASPSHQANILNASFQDIGVAALSCVFQGANTTVVVAHYGATYSAPRPVAKPAPAPSPVPKPTARVAPQPAPVTKTNKPSQNSEAQPTPQQPDKPADVTPPPVSVPKIEVNPNPGFGTKLWKMVWAARGNQVNVQLINGLRV